MADHNHDHDHSHNHGAAGKDGIIRLTTKDLVKDFLKKRKRFKNKVQIGSDAIPPAPPRSSINHLAIILDGEVQEIMRAQNRLAALLLSEPQFVEFDPDEVKPDIGWIYSNGKFYSGE